MTKFSGRTFAPKSQPCRGRSGTYSALADSIPYRRAGATYVTLRKAVQKGLQLLSLRDRRRLILVTTAQMATSLLDLVGVLLIGVVAALSLAVVSGDPPSGLVKGLIDKFGWADFEPVYLALALAVTAGLLLMLKSGLNIVLTRRIYRFLANRQALVSGRLASGLLSRPLLEVQRHSSQETAYALTTGVGYSTVFLLGPATVVVTEAALLAVLAFGLLIISPVVTIFAVAFFALVAWVLHRLLSERAGRLGVVASTAEVASYMAVQEALRTYREIVVTDRRVLYVERFQKLRWQVAQVQADLAFFTLVPKYVFEIALVVGAALLAGSQLLTSSLTAAVSVISVFLAAGTRIVPSMLRAQGAVLTIRSSAGQAVPTFELADELHLTDEVIEKAAAAEDTRQLSSRIYAKHPGFVADVRVDAVELHYPGTDVAALWGISLHLPAGKSLALVGPTGAGKSSLADVILGVVKPDRGRVLIGGARPEEALQGWPGAIGYVPQDVAMANGTVRENVGLGLPNEAIDDELVWEALTRAHLADFLQESRNGLDTVIGENGIKLSGGQRQRLGIARALYTRPKLLILDEATSALDAETEKLISETMQELEGSVTTITIAHRLATIRHCDVVLYMEGGRVLASGTFQEVRDMAPRFDLQANLLGL